MNAIPYTPSKIDHCTMLGPLSINSVLARLPSLEEDLAEFGPIKRS